MANKDTALMPVERTNHMTAAQTRSRKTGIFVIIILAAAWLLGLKAFLINLWLLLAGEGYEIPAESNAFKFVATVMNDGSGDWWVYAEDDGNYYHYTGENGRPYIAYAKSWAAACEGFDPHDSSTWCSK